MTIKKQVKFTPELLIESPRRSQAIPNYSGTHALFTVSSFSIDTETETTELRVIDLKSREVRLFSDDKSIQEPQWFLDTAIFWLKYADGDITEVWMGDVLSIDRRRTLIGKIETKISAPKILYQYDGSIVFTFVAPVSVDGMLLNPETLPKPRSSAREWETLRTRFWAMYHDPYSSTLWCTRIIKDTDRGSFKLCNQPPTDLLRNTSYIFPWSNGDAVGGPSYELSSAGVVLTTFNDVDHDLATSFVSDTFFIPIADYGSPNIRKPLILKSCPKGVGQMVTAHFSTDGTKLAVIKQRDTKETVRTNSKLFIMETNDPESLIEVPIVKNRMMEDWDLSPRDMVWSQDSRSIYLVSASGPRTLLFYIAIPSRVQVQGKWEYLPTMAFQLRTPGFISSVYRMQGKGSRLFINSTSFVESSEYSILNTEWNQLEVLSSASNFGSLYGISSSQISEFRFRGAKNYPVQSWMILPSDFDDTKTYPCMLLVHGGPYWFWQDEWSTRWNPVLFAEQGYILILPNIIGSKGFGEKFSQEIIGDWATLPLQDLENCWDWVGKNVKSADLDRAVIMGESYGGYMMNWVAGKPFGKKFKTIIVQDGIFSMSSLYSTDNTVADVPFEIGAAPWDDLSKVDSQDPCRFTDQWTQPMLIIHSELDYRCTLDNGYAAFTTCKMRGIPARLLSFTDEGHFILKRRNALQWNRTVLGWCNHYTSNHGGIQLEAPVSENNIRGRPWKAPLATRSR